MDRSITLASASKFPAAVAVAGAVENGFLTFDTKVCEVFEWWSCDSSDLRSGVTLRHLLSFTSGFYNADAGGGSILCVSPPESALFTPEDCAKDIYHKQPFLYAPGTTFAYHILHLQVIKALNCGNLRMVTG